MIKYADGEIIQLLPENLLSQEVIAISYALRMAVSRMANWRSNTMLYANIDGLPDELLDYLSVELQSQYYSNRLPIDKKRALVKNTLAWYQQAGTVSAVKEMIDIIFGNGEVVEWPDFDEGPGVPGEFDIITDIEATPDAIQQLNSVIKNVKNASSTLRGLTIKKNFRLILKALLDGSMIKLQTELYDIAKIMGEAITIESDMAEAMDQFNAHLVKDGRWYFNSEYLFDGTRRFNSSILEVDL